MDGTKYAHKHNTVGENALNKAFHVGNVQKAMTLCGFSLENYISISKCCPLFFFMI
jgi:hypothetical protein